MRSEPNMNHEIILSDTKYFRSVSEEEKSLAVAVNSFFQSVLGTIFRVLTFIYFYNDVSNHAFDMCKVYAKPMW